MLNVIYLIFELLIISLIVLHGVISRRISENNPNKKITNIKIRIVIDIILSIAFIIQTSISILIKQPGIIIIMNIFITIIYEANVDSGIRVLRIIKNN